MAEQNSPQEKPGLGDQKMRPAHNEQAIRAVEETRLRVLLIEDDERDQRAFQRFVESEKLPYDYMIAGSLSEARGHLASQEFDVLVSDYYLGDNTGLDILKLVGNVPVIIVTGVGGEKVAIEAWKAGAYDYLTKDFGHEYLKILPKTILNAIMRKTMEDTLDRKQKNLEAIFDAAPVCMLLADENMVVTRVNDAVRRMLHKDYPQIISRRIGNALGCANADNHRKGCGYALACSLCPFEKTVRVVLDSQRSVRNVVTHTTLMIDGRKTAFWLQVSAEPVVIDGQKYTVVAIDDVTKRKMAESERRSAEERYRTIFENSAVAITMTDEQERLISWNKFMERLLGMGRRDLYLKPIESLYPADEWEKIRDCNVRQKGMQHHLETRMFRKDGKLIDVDMSLSVLTDPDGKITGSIGVITDVTERREAEERAKEAAELKSQFVATVSHELRTPLNAVKEGVAIVLDEVTGRLNVDQKKFLDIAKRNVDRLGDLITDILDFQKLEADRMKLDLQTNSIDEVLSDVRETMALYARKNQVELSFGTAKDMPRARFDRAKIIQVLTNLIGNAIKFTPQGGRVSVNVQQQNEDWVISVSDTGMGIPKEALPKIFERFYRVNRPGTEIQGTGLGLAIVHKIVTMHGGRIDVQSEPDRGTVFTVFLPIEANPSPESLAIGNDEVLEDAIAERPHPPHLSERL
jgi:PAS domain S-box-containing protein